MRVWLDGSVVPLERARVSVLDHGLTVGDGVFETLKVVRGTPFAITRHIARLQRSAQLLGLPIPAAETVAAAAAEVVEANRDALGPLGRLRITVTSGVGPPGSERGPGPPTMIAVAMPAKPWPSTTSAITLDWPRNERSPLTGVKTTSYAEHTAALAQARTAGASEAIWGNTRAELCEGTGSNVFLIRAQGLLVTPPLDSGCLAGITRELVCEWFEVQQEALPLVELAAAPELFLTSSTRDVHPVAQLDGSPRPIVGGARYAAQFAARAGDDLDP